MTSPFPWRSLDRSLSPAERSGIHGAIAALLRWQRTLDRWPTPRAAPDATPFVSLYARGTLRGCFGSDEGRPHERVTRAFLRALDDVRYGGIAPVEREHLVAEVRYTRNVRRVSAERALVELEPGVHGVAMVRDTALPVLILPQVARDQALSAEAILRLISVKSGGDADAWRSAELALFETEDVVVRADGGRDAVSDAIEEATQFLAGLVAPSGVVTFAVDGRRRERQAIGPMFHGRAALTVSALAERGVARRRLARTRRWLQGEIASSLEGRAAPGWPDDPAMALGTVALACLAGVDLERELQSLAARPSLWSESWYAGQTALVLGTSTPAGMWSALVADLDARPWAPWTARAARARGDAEVYARCERALVDSIADEAPYRGGARRPGDIPEIASTALVVEALTPARSPAARAAVRRARAFLRRWQLRGGHVPGSLEPGLVAGAFPTSPLLHLARCDVTAHALMALAD